ncbi:MAG: CoxG family protein [Paracoccaceae bacterium]
MILNGTVLLALPPDAATTGFQEPDVLGTFLPFGSELTRTGPGAFAFTVIKEAGLVTLKLPGTLTVVPEGAGYRFDAKAKHMLGGSAALSLLISFAAADGGTMLSYDGDLESGGLAGRLLRDRADQAQAILDAKFDAVKSKLESRHRARAV